MQVIVQGQRAAMIRAPAGGAGLIQAKRQGRIRPAKPADRMTRKEPSGNEGIGVGAVSQCGGSPLLFIAQQAPPARQSIKHGVRGRDK
jgi:hypothetical protein